MPIVGASYSPWLFWDGRKDSLWSQALGPLEDPAEHGGNRTRFAHLTWTHYRAEYEAVFGALPDVSSLPADAGVVVSVTNISSSDAGSYTVVVTNSAGSITSAPALLVTFPPLITSQPANVTVHQGQPASFSVSATGQTPFSYQWQRDSGAGWTNVPNATNRIFSIGSAQGADAGNYRVIVTNPIGTETSQSATLTVIVPPTITTDPASQTNVVGSTVTFNVGVSGSAPFHYQWKKGVVEMLNETNAALVLAGITGADAATYSVVVTNAAGMDTSAGATLTVEGACEGYILETPRGGAGFGYDPVFVGAGLMYATAGALVVAGGRIEPIR